MDEHTQVPTQQAPEQTPPLAPTQVPTPSPVKKLSFIPPYIYVVIVILVIAIGVLAFLPKESIAPDATPDDTTEDVGGQGTSMENPFVITEPLGENMVGLPEEIKGISNDPSVIRLAFIMESGGGVSAEIVSGEWKIATAGLGFVIGENHFSLVPSYANGVQGEPQEFTITIIGPSVNEDASTLIVNWLEQPVKIETYAFLGPERMAAFHVVAANSWEKPESANDSMNSWVYKVGTVRGGTYDTNGVYVFSTGLCLGQEMGCSMVRYRLLKDSEGTMRFLKQYSGGLRPNETFLVDEVLDEVMIPGLSAPQEFTLRGLRLYRTSRTWDSGAEGWFFAQELVPITWHEDYGTIYTTPVASSTSRSPFHAFYIKLPDSRVVAYTYDITFFEDKRTPQITWKDGTANTVDYGWGDFGGCGMRNLFAVRAVETLKPDERLERAGVSSTGDMVYTFKNSDEQEFKDMYENYRPYHPEGEEVLTYDEFVARRPIVFWQDSFGRWIQFTRMDLLPAVECAKPIIYLYPEKEIAARVIVDLKGEMTVSEPPHGTRGWDVVARPDGYVVVNGEIYPNLFWEGTGVDYVVPKQGFVIETKDADAWFTKTLAEIGFTERENAEFREFWVPRMPKTPYVFITFVPQADFDRDATLRIIPKPDYVYRVFMESRGLYEPMTVKPLPLPKIVRKGFTVVEWGGALR